MLGFRLKTKFGWDDVLFWLSVLLSIGWITALGLMAWHRQRDFMPVLKPWEEGRLSLNEIGDTLAGVFAPLAFLWFFVSTSLQRLELKETRLVLAQQQKELAQSAKETADQTKIMQQQLETARSEEVFGEHRLRMYYLAKYLFHTAANLSIAIKAHGSHQTPALFPPSTSGVQRDDDPSVDNTFERLRIHLIRTKLPEEVEEVTRLKEFQHGVEYVRNELQELVYGERYTNNALVQARVKGTTLDKVLHEIVVFEELVRRLRSISVSADAS
jgi:hypothetical protein